MPVYASTLARGLLGNKIKEHKLHNNPLLRARARRRRSRSARSRSSRSASATRSPTRWASPSARRSASSSTPATSSSTTRPVDGKLSDFAHPRPARRGRRHLPAVRLDAGREPGLHAVRADRRRGVPRDHGAARRARHRGHLRQQHRPHPAGPRRRRRRSTARWPSSAARWSRTSGSPPTSATSTTTRSRSSPRTRSRTSRPSKLVIATTGAQGEPMAGLARMANRDHRFVEIQPGDTVIVSASPIPGNEEYVARTIDNLFKAGANVFYHTIKRAHVSGPRQPGRAQADARPDQAAATSSRCTASSGCWSSTAAWRSRRASRRRTSSSSRTASRSRSSPTAAPAGARRSPAGYVYVDGLSVGEVGDVVLRDRRALANDGMFIVVVTVDKQTGNVVGPAGDHHPRLRPRQRAGPAHRRAPSDRVRGRVDEPGRPHQRGRRCSRARSRTACRGSCTSRPSAARWSSRSSWRSRWHARRRRSRRAPTRPRTPAPRRARPASRRRGRRRAGPSRARSSASCCSWSGAVTLIALVLPGRRGADRLVAERHRAVRSGRALAAAARPASLAGVLRRAGTGRRARGWGVTALGGVLVFLGGLGLIQLILGHGRRRRAGRGRRLRRQALAGLMAALVSPAGAFVVLVGIVIAGLLLAPRTRPLREPPRSRSPRGGRALAGATGRARTPRPAAATGPDDRRPSRSDRSAPRGGRASARQRPTRPGRRRGRCPSRRSLAARPSPARRPLEPDGRAAAHGRRRRRDRARRRGRGAPAVAADRPTDDAARTAARDGAAHAAP